MEYHHLYDWLFIYSFQGCVKCCFQTSMMIDWSDKKFEVLIELYKVINVHEGSGFTAEREKIAKF